MKTFLLTSFTLIHFMGFSQGFSKTGTEDLYLYKATVLYKDGNGFIADVQKNFDSISILPIDGVIFLRVVRLHKNAPIGAVNSGQRRAIADTILRSVSQFQIDTTSYNQTKLYTKQGKTLKGNNLVYFLEQDESLKVGETFYFNSYAVLRVHAFATEFGMPVLTIMRDFLFGDGTLEDEYEEEESII